MIGAVWFYYINQVEPQTGFDPIFDLTLVLMAFLGGYGSIAGPVLGALIIEPLTLWLNTQPAVQRGYLSEILLGAHLPHRRAVPAAGDHPDRRRAHHQGPDPGPPGGHPGHHDGSARHGIGDHGRVGPSSVSSGGGR